MGIEIVGLTGETGHGYYTEALLKHMHLVNTDVDYMLREVGKEVHTKSDGKQNPYRTSWLRHRIVKLRSIDPLADYAFIDFFTDALLSLGFVVFWDILKVSLGESFIYSCTIKVKNR